MSAESKPLFEPDAFEFLKTLAANNNREFFTSNRDIYEENLRVPLENLTAAAQDKYGPGKVMRPNRDVRFSADKSPYRTNASMWAGTVGGVYLSVSTSGIEAGGGLYEPTRDQLSRARDAISVSPLAAAELRKAISALLDDGFEVAGPSLKTTPKGYDKEDPNIELLRLKHYAALKHLPATASRAEIEQTWAAVEPLIAWAGKHIGPALSRP
jgi:uncharacterized protein (TIGR02453 family)